MKASVITYDISEVHLALGGKHRDSDIALK